MKRPRSCQIAASWLDIVLTMYHTHPSVHITLASSSLTASASSMLCQQMCDKDRISTLLGGWATHLLQVCELGLPGMQGKWVLDQIWNVYTISDS